MHGSVFQGLAQGIRDLFPLIIIQFRHAADMEERTDGLHLAVKVPALARFRSGPEGHVRITRGIDEDSAP